MKKFLAGKKDNKGFSLVELIVVILIMAIIAVALAPQVIKWVGKSAQNTDESNAATIKASVQTAVADWISQGQGSVDINNVEYSVESKEGIKNISSPDSSVVTVESVEDKVIGTNLNGLAALEKLIVETMGEFPEVKSDAEQKFVIIINYNKETKNSNVEVVKK